MVGIVTVVRVVHDGLGHGGESRREPWRRLAAIAVDLVSFGLKWLKTVSTRSSPTWSAWDLADGQGKAGLCRRGRCQLAVASVAVAKVNIRAAVGISLPWSESSCRRKGPRRRRDHGHHKYISRGRSCRGQININSRSVGGALICRAMGEFQPSEVGEWERIGSSGDSRIFSRWIFGRRSVVLDVCAYAEYFSGFPPVRCGRLSPGSEAQNFGRPFLWADCPRRNRVVKFQISGGVITEVVAINPRYIGDAYI